MKYFAFLFAFVSLAAIFSFEKSKKINNENALPESNPFSEPSTLPFQAPPFDKINDADYKPALEEGINEQQKEIEAIAENSAEPTFANTFITLEKSGQLLNRVNNVFNVVTGANTDDTLQKLQEEIAPKLAANQDAIYLNEKLFNRVETVYNERAKLKLDGESNRLVEYYYQQFVIAGAKLSAADKEQLKKLNAEEATLSAKFSNQLVNAAKAGALIITDSSALAGLPQADKNAFAQNGKEKNSGDSWLIPLQNTTQQPHFNL